MKINLEMKSFPSTKFFFLIESRKMCAHFTKLKALFHNTHKWNASVYQDIPKIVMRWEKVVTKEERTPLVKVEKSFKEHKVRL